MKTKAKVILVLFAFALIAACGSNDDSNEDTSIFDYSANVNQEMLA